MVSADNLNYDVLGLIFTHVSGNDLVAVSLVSRSFLTGVTPRLYHTLFFRHAQAKRYPRLISPFAAVLAHRALAVHVRKCEITALPLYKGQPRLEFLKDCVQSLELCSNLTGFFCQTSILPSFLLCLKEKDRLKELRVNVSLTMEQADVLVRLKGLKKVILEHASWCIMNLLSQWMGSMSSTLTHLTVYMSSELNEVVLESTLSQLPNLLGLRILSCVNIKHCAVLRLVSHTPHLQSLAFTTWDSPETQASSYSDLCSLRTLIIDTRNAVLPSSVPPLWTGIIASTVKSAAPISSLTLKVSDGLLIGDGFMQDLVNAHAGTLTSLRLINCGISIESLKLVASKCHHLEKLSMVIPIRDLILFAGALALSRSLHTLVDVAESHTNHGPGPTLSQENVRFLMATAQCLRKIISDNRTWEGHVSEDGHLQIKLERFTSLPSTSLLGIAD